MTGTELIALPKELRIERRVGLLRSVRANSATIIPVALLAPLAFMVEAVPAAIGILMVVGLSLREFRRASGDVLPQLELADSGELAEASVAIAQMVKNERDWHRKTFLVGMLASVEMRAGHWDIAEALARESLRHTSRRPTLERLLEGNLAMILMLSDQSEEALEILPTGPTPDPVTDYYRLVVWARAGRWEDIVKYKYQRRPQLPGFRHSNRVMALCKALALAQTGGGALKLQRYLDEAKPRLNGEYDYLSENWLELAELIATQPELRTVRSILERA